MKEENIDRATGLKNKLDNARIWNDNPSVEDIRFVCKTRSDRDIDYLVREGALGKENAELIMATVSLMIKPAIEQQIKHLEEEIKKLD